ncbi:cupin domain-containing protein [Bordetella tumbae]|uniref:cupin domain-containing protein n=1 Tax=Bordetella tumbae TaxID=1649139 RepID=UPI0039EF84B7
MPQTPTWLVRESQVPGYHPANHTGTLNRRLIGPETVGSKHVEVLLGVIEKGQGALPHAHPGIEQVCYLLEGTARAQVGDESADMVAGDCCYFPPDIPHVFTVTSDTPVRLLVIYSPPYEESPDRVIRGFAAPTTEKAPT